MDTSKEYIKMCEKAVEIQEAWKPSVPDYFAYKEYLDKSVLCIWYSDFNAICKSIKYFKKSKIWLPRQDQLQEMFRHKDLNYLSAYFYSFITQPRIFEGERANENYCNIFKSMEQLWLAFVMKEKYNKTWDKNKWKELT